MTSGDHPIRYIVDAQKRGEARGIYSCCSANPFVIKAALLRGKLYSTPVLIEATANQVDQYGGYSGMTPPDYYALVHDLAHDAGISPEIVILGGDHLGPLPFAKEPEEAAMNKAVELIRQYVLHGFTKIHIDTSMRLGDDSPDGLLTDETIACRAALLCRAAEEAYEERQCALPGAQKPVYVIGSEVPIPGGVQEKEESVCITSPDACERTIAAFQAAYAAQGLDDVWERVIGVVVQPGVEFGDAQIVAYDRKKASTLTAALKRYPGMVFEGHSTDYQTRGALRCMVEDGIAILKVGPALTFALREGLLALECIERELFKGKGNWLSDFRSVLDAAMMDNPQYWSTHYHGNGNEQHYARMFSLSDRARYYLTQPAVRASTERLLTNLGKEEIPPALISQYMPMQYKALSEGTLLKRDPEALLLDRISDCIDDYLYATGIIQ